MRVAINARLLASPSLREWSRYTVNLAAELVTLGKDVCLYADAPLHPGHLGRFDAPGCHVRVAPTQSYPLWEQRWLPAQCAADRIDVLHWPFNYGLPWRTPCPRVLTLHDAIYHVIPVDAGPRSWSDARRELPTAVYDWIARTRADRIITVSEHAKRDLVRHLGIAAERTDVVYDAAEPRFSAPVDPAWRETVLARHSMRGPYALYLGGWARSKNVPFLLRAFAGALSNLRTDEGGAAPSLVLVGGTPDERGPVDELARSLGIDDRVVRLGWVDDGDLPALYSASTCFVYPSTYEGFGLQLCEAMGAGCPTLAPAAASLPEVLGNGGVTFPLDDERDLSTLIGRVFSDPSYATRPSQAARARSAAFSWRATAERTIDVYRSLVPPPVGACVR